MRGQRTRRSAFTPCGDGGRLVTNVCMRGEVTADRRWRMAHATWHQEVNAMGAQCDGDHAAICSQSKKKKLISRKVKRERL